MKFTKVVENQLPTLVALARETFVSTFVEQNNPDDFAAYVDTAFTLEVFKKEFYTEGSLFYFAENEGALIGYFKLNHNKIPHDAINTIPKFDTHKTLTMTELERIYLTEATHGKGFALLMMDEIVQLAQANKSAYIWLGVWEENRKAINFYQKMGFDKFGEHIFMIGEDAQTDWLMWKEIVGLFF